MALRSSSWLAVAAGDQETVNCSPSSAQVSPDEKPYDRHVPLWINVYVVVHFLLVLHASMELAARKNVSPGARENVSLGARENVSLGVGRMCVQGAGRM